MRIAGIIPARYSSTRFPAKVLQDIKGKSMVRRVYEQCRKTRLLNEIIVATDHEKVYVEAESFEAKVIMTGAEHPSGTDRCFEAASKMELTPDYVINIQCDQPLIDPAQVDALAETLDGEVEIATLARKIENNEELFNPGEAKIVLNNQQEALYFSRSPIPYLRDVPREEWAEEDCFYKHIGMYAYRYDILEKITRLSVSDLEKAESLEQLRWLQNGYRIKVVETNIDTICIDTPEDLERLLNSGLV